MARSLPIYSTGTVGVAFTGGAWTVTGSGTNFISPDGVPNYTLVGGDMFIIPNVGFGPIAAVASATSLTLTNWTGAPVASGTAYQIARFEGLPSNAVAALVNQLLTMGTDANPPAYATVDTGAVRTKWDDDGAGNARMRVRASNLTDAAYVTAARVNDATGVWQVPAIVGARVAVSDANYAVATGVSTVAYTAITAARVVTLPAASSFVAGQQLLIVDESGACSGSNTITASRAGSDTINGATSAVMNTAYSYLALESNGSNAWTIVDKPGIAAGGALVGTTLSLARQAVSDAAYTVAAGISTVAFTALTAARVVSLPAASSFAAGQQLLIVDESGACSATNTITLSRAGSDTINGATSAVIASAYGYLALESNGSNAWTVVDTGQVGMIGDSGSGGAAGYVPAPPAGSAASHQVLGAGGSFVGQMAGFRNRLRNALFTINQRVVSGTVTLAAGAYGHNGVKAGASGATYTFLASGNDVAITITAGSLILPIDAANIEGGNYVVSQAGTAQARVWQGTGYTGSGSYASTPFVAGSLTANTRTNLEFSTGTLALPQFEPGSLILSATSFEQRPIGVELGLCQRYFFSLAATTAYGYFCGGIAGSPTTFLGILSFPLAMRAAPTISFSAASTFQLLKSSSTFAGTSGPSASQATMQTASIGLTVSSGTHDWLRRPREGRRRRNLFHSWLSGALAHDLYASARSSDRRHSRRRRRDSARRSRQFRLAGLSSMARGGEHADAGSDSIGGASRGASLRERHRGRSRGHQHGYLGAECDLWRRHDRASQHHRDRDRNRSRPRAARRRIEFRLSRCDRRAAHVHAKPVHFARRGDSRLRLRARSLCRRPGCAPDAKRDNSIKNWRRSAPFT